MFDPYKFHVSTHRTWCVDTLPKKLLSRKYQRRIAENNFNIFLIEKGTSQEYMKEIISKSIR